MSFNVNIGNIRAIELPNTVVKKNKISGVINTTVIGVKRVLLLDRRTLKLYGSCIANPDNSWAIYTEFPEDGELFAICLDDTGTHNADIYDRLSLCTMDYNYDVEKYGNLILGSKESSVIEFYPTVDKTKYSWPIDIISEDVKGAVHEFKYDTVGEKGHFLDSLGNPISVGLLGSESKVGDKSIIEMASNTNNIFSIDDSGIGANTVSLEKKIAGRNYVTDFFGDNSCLMFAPLDVDLRCFGKLGASLEGKGIDFRPEKETGHPFGGDAGAYLVRPDSCYIDSNIRLPPYSASVGYTFSFWFKIDNWGDMVGKADLFVQHPSFFLSAYPSNRLFLQALTGTGPNYSSSWYGSSSAYLPNDTWIHLAVCLGPSQQYTIYIGGVQRHNVTTIPPWIADEINVLETVNSNFSIASRKSNILGWNNLYGNLSARISMFRIFDRRVTAQEALDLFNERPIAGDVEKVEKISNISTKSGTVVQVENAINQYNSVLLSPKNKNNLPLKYSSLEKVEVPHNHGGKYQRVIFKGSIYRQHLTDASWWDSVSSNKSLPRQLFSDWFASNRMWYMWWSENRKLNDFTWFSIDLERNCWFSGFSFWIISSTTYNSQYPIDVDIYVSFSGEFLGEESYAGKVQFKENYGLSSTTEIFKLETPVYCRHVRFVVKDVARISTVSNRFGVNNIHIELLEEVHLEAKKARTFVIDLYDGHTNDTMMGLRKILPVLNGLPLNTEGWEIYSSSPTDGMDVLIDVKKLANVDGAINAWYVWSTPNVRLILVAPHEVYFDDIYIQNYFSMFTSSFTIYSTRGVKNLRIQYTDQVYTDTTFEAVVTGGKYFSMFQMPQHFYIDNQANSLSQINLSINNVLVDFKTGGYIKNTYKEVKARTVAFDFSSNHGSTTYMGVKKIEFWYKGVRIHADYIRSSSLATSNSGTVANTTNVTTAVYSTTASWRSASGQISNQRLYIRFSQDIKFDLIRFVNSNNGTSYSWNAHSEGVADVTIYGSMANLNPSTVFGSALVNQFVIKPFTELPMCYVTNTTTATEHVPHIPTSMPLFPEKRETWKTRSVVFDFHSNWGGRNIGLHQLSFFKEGIGIPYRNTWSVFCTDQESNSLGIDAIKGYWLISLAFYTERSWRALNKTGQVRLIVVFDQLKEFDEIDFVNWFIESENNMDVHNGVQGVTIQITDTVLTTTNNFYNTVVPGGTVIYDGSLTKNQNYESGIGVPFKPIIKAPRRFIFRDIDLLIQSNNANGSVVFTDESINEFPILSTGTPQHSIAQPKIGMSSIDVSTGYLLVEDIRRYPLETNNLEFGLWVYPTSTLGDKGLISRWEPTAGHLSYKMAINNGKLEFTYSTDGISSTILASIGTVSENVWTWIKVKRMGPSLFMFLNDVLDSTHVMTDSIFDSQAIMAIGGFDSNIGNCFQGYINTIIVRMNGVPEIEEVPPTEPISISSKITDTALNLYFSFSFEEGLSTFKMWTGSAWRSIITKDPLIHGVIGDTDWYYRQDGLNWVKSPINESVNAMSLAAEYPNNQMNKLQVEALTSVEWAGVDGFNESGCFDVMISFYKEEKSYIELTDLIINGKKYWISYPINLKKITDVVTNSLIDWSFKITEEKFIGESYIEAYKVFCRVTGDVNWTECPRGASIPGVPVGMNTTGKFLYIKTEFDLSKSKYINSSLNPMITVEIS